MGFSRRLLLKSAVALACSGSYTSADQLRTGSTCKTFADFADTDGVVAGQPRFIAAARVGEDQFAGVLLDAEGTVVASMPMPARAHGACADARTHRACVFARRPGMYFSAFDLRYPDKQTVITPEEGRRFYGHGVYSDDGNVLFATENDYDSMRGVIGIYDVSAGYRKTGEWESGGVGPHEVVRVPGTSYLVIGNGGIHTHPDTGREKLNLDSMQPSITVIDSRNGKTVAYHELSDRWHQVSLRHLACSVDGQIWYAGQYEGTEVFVDALAGFISLGESMQTFQRGRSKRGLYPVAIPSDLLKRSQFYLTSVAVSGDEVVYSAAKGGLVFRVNRLTRQVEDSVSMIDCSGVAAVPERCDGKTASGQFLLSSGTGVIASMDSDGVKDLSVHHLQWDNHLYRV